MKRVLLLLVACFLITSSVQAASQGDLATAKSKYRDYLISYLKNENNEWNEMYFLVDLDYDGIPELFGGQEAQIYSPINVAITYKNKKLTKLKFTGDYGVSGFERDSKGNMNIGLSTIEGIKLYKDKKTKKLKLIGKDYAGRSQAWTNVFYEISISKGNLHSKKIFGEEVNNEEQPNYTYYYIGSKKVKKANYEKIYKSYFSNLQEIPLKIHKSGHWDIDVNQEQQVYEFVNAGFKKFGYVEPVSKGELTTQQAVKSVLKARDIFWGVVSGDCARKPLTYKGEPYRYMCSNVDTKAKLTNYLAQIYSSAAIKEAYTQYSLLEYKGKMIQPDGDMGSALNWGKSTTKIVSKQGTVLKVEFTVPYDSDDNDIEKVLVTFIQEKGTWKINKFGVIF